MLKSSVQHKLLNSLPNDKPVTAIQVVENIGKCPPGFHPISRTYDQDQDADLRESSIFKSSTARYLCLSKSQGLPNFVIQELFILTDKYNPPKGFSVLNKTADGDQRAWRKKQLCYRLVHVKDIKVAITDIIICSRLKKAPEGFQLAGELNGVTICFKMGNVEDKMGSPENKGVPERPPRPAPSIPSPMYPSIGNNGGDHDYEILMKPGYGPPGIAGGPLRPAPRPPPNLPHQNSTHTMGPLHNALDNVPFILNPKYSTAPNSAKFQFPVIKAKTMQQLMKEYNYPFTVERQT